jgi:hypothetical protein
LEEDDSGDHWNRRNILNLEKEDLGNGRRRILEILGAGI